MGVRRSMLRCLAALAAWLAVSQALALDPARGLKQYHHGAWTLREGAPPDAWAMAQTQDGLLWFGSPTGLYSFDGLRFEHFRPRDGGAPITRDVSALLAEPDGGMWIGLRSAGPVMHLKNGRLTRDDDPNGLGKSTISAFARDRDGVLWGINVSQLMRRVDGRWQDAGPAMGLPAELYLTSLMVDSRGALWVQGPTGTFVRSRGAEKFTALNVQLGRGELTETRDGRVWYGGEPQLRSLSNTQGRPEPTFPGLPASIGVGDVLSDRDGALWFVLEGRVARVREPESLGRPGKGLPPSVESYGVPDGLSGDAAHTFFEDRDGNIWVTTNGGVDRFRKPKLNSVDIALGAEAGWARAGQGAVWAATGYGGLFRLDGRGSQPFPSAGIELTSLYGEPDGTLWIGAFDRLMRSTDGKTFERVALPAKTPSTGVRAVARDGTGALWVLIGRSGLFRFKNERWERNGGLRALDKTPQALAVDPTGRLWLAYPKGLLVRVDGDEVTPYNGPDMGAPQALHAEGDRLWLGATDGLALLQQGRFTQLLGQGEERFEGVSGIVKSDDGVLWLNAADGVFRFSAAEQDRAAAAPAQHRIAFQLLDHNDGLQGVATQLRPLPSALKGDDGRLWFSTSRNLFWIDPAGLRRNERAPQPQLRALHAHGRHHEPGARVELPQGSTQFDIEYTAVELSLPEKLRFRYRLEGVDADWQDAQARRQAFYTNLGPGDYRFSVVAANEDGVWSEPSEPLVISIPPAFHQTRWFQALVLMGVLAMLWGAHRMRHQQLSKRLHARLEARMQERERIARELHDTLLQSTQGLILGVQAIAQQTSADDPARHRIERVLQRADEAMVEGRERARALREDLPRDGHALPHALALVAEELAETESVSLRCTVEGLPRELRRHVPDEVYRIGREALVNAWRHARASLVELRISYLDDALVLRVLDNGVGFDDSALNPDSRPGHWGLVGMRERATRLGAELTLHPREGGGTEVLLQVPAAQAYALAPVAGIWARLLKRLKRPRDAVSSA